MYIIVNLCISFNSIDIEESSESVSDQVILDRYESLAIAFSVTGESSSPKVDFLHQMYLEFPASLCSL